MAMGQKPDENKKVDKEKALKIVICQPLNLSTLFCAGGGTRTPMPHGTRS